MARWGAGWSKAVSTSAAVHATAVAALLLAARRTDTAAPAAVAAGEWLAVAVLAAPEIAPPAAPAPPRRAAGQWRRTVARGEARAPFDGSPATAALAPAPEPLISGGATAIAAGAGLIAAGDIPPPPAGEAPAVAAGEVRPGDHTSPDFGAQAAAARAGAGDGDGASSGSDPAIDGPGGAPPPPARHRRRPLELFGRVIGGGVPASAPAYPDRPYVSLKEATSLRTHDFFPRLPAALWTEPYAYVAEVELCVAEDGRVADAVLVSHASARLDAMILEAVRTWQYQPRLVGGRPAAFCHAVVIKYALP